MGTLGLAYISQFSGQRRWLHVYSGLSRGLWPSVPLALCTAAPVFSCPTPIARAGRRAGGWGVWVEGGGVAHSKHKAQPWSEGPKRLLRLWVGWGRGSSAQTMGRQIGGMGVCARELMGGVGVVDIWEWHALGALEVPPWPLGKKERVRNSNTNTAEAPLNSGWGLVGGGPLGLSLTKKKCGSDLPCPLV